MSEDFQGLIDNWKERVSSNQDEQYNYAAKLNRDHYVIGVITTVFVTVSGATILTDIQDPTIKTIAGVIGLIAAVLSAVQTFYSHAKRSELHKASAVALGQARREIEVLEKFPPTKKTEREKRFRDIEELISQADKGAPLPMISAPEDGGLLLRVMTNQRPKLSGNRRHLVKQTNVRHLSPKRKALRKK